MDEIISRILYEKQHVTLVHITGVDNCRIEMFIAITRAKMLGDQSLYQVLQVGLFVKYRVHCSVGRAPLAERCEQRAVCSPEQTFH